MTFVLKDLGALRAEYEDTKYRVATGNGKTKVQDLSDKRKYEFEFLSAILEQLEAELSESAKPGEMSKELALVFYGAMVVMMQDIEDNRFYFESEGLLHARLELMIGIDSAIKAEDRPSKQHYVKFHTELANFLTRIFKENDSRNGFEEKHLLKAIPTPRLKHFMEIAYILRQNAEKTANEALSKEGKSTIEANSYRVDNLKPTPESAVATYKGTWADLQKAVHKLINDATSKKYVPSIAKLKNPDRVTQFTFIETVAKSLKDIKSTGINDKERTAIMLGCLYLVREQIGHKEYKEDYCSTAELSSVTHIDLTNILGVKDVAPQEIEALICAAQSYLRYMTIESPKTEKPEQPEKSSKSDKGASSSKAADKSEKEKPSAEKMIRAKHFLSDVPHFKLNEWLGLASEIACACRVNALGVALEGVKIEKPPAAPSKSYMSAVVPTLNAINPLNFFNKSKKPAEAIDDETLVLEKEGNSSLTQS